MDSKLFVGNLTFSVTDEDLVEMFSPLGLVVNVKIVTDRDRSPARVRICHNEHQGERGGGSGSTQRQRVSRPSHEGY